jgi:surfeit locus 1 family protein
VSPARRALFVVTVLAVAGAAIGLGRWQVRRLRDRRANNAVLLTARERPPLELTTTVNSGTPIDSGRRVVARGSFEPHDQIILRGRVQNDGPGLQVVTPFELADGSVLWVVRGFVASPDAVTPPDTIATPAPDTVTITGLALAIPVTSDSGAPLRHNGVTTWKRLDRGTLARLRAGSLPSYLLLAGDATGPGRLATSPPPELDDGPHLSYAIQWFGIALAVLTFGVIVLWRDGPASPRRPEAP